jgi:hypothetical protein
MFRRSLFLVGVAACAAGSGAQTTVRAQVKPYRVSSDFREVSNRAAFRKYISLRPEHNRLLQRNLFVVSPTDDLQLYWTYGSNDYKNIPSLVTVDSVLHLYHVFYDSTLRSTEERMFLPKAKRLADQMFDRSMNTFIALNDADLKEASAKNAAYFAVASTLFGGEPKAAGSAHYQAADELKLIGAAKGFTDSPIFKRKIDYSQFIVRGHYTKSDQLKMYFRGMMWFGLIPFELQAKAGEEANVPYERIRQTLLITHELYAGGLMDDWEAIYEPTSLLVGEANNLTPPEIKQAMDSVYGKGAGLKELANDAKLPQFAAALKNLRKAKIQGKWRDNQAEQALQFKFMGQRYIPDSEILQEVSDQQRPMPTGLDVMTVLGSTRAQAIIDANLTKYNPLNWPDYHDERNRMEAKFSALPEATWRSNLYWSWLYAVKALLEPLPAGYPSFMRNAAWEAKSLSTALASWAELRHDTILYGQQSVAEMGDGDEEQPYVRGYVEPNVKFYDRLIALTRQTHEGLLSRKLINAELGQRFVEFRQLLTFLRSVSIRELQNQKLTRAEHLRIRKIEGELSNLTETMLLYGTNYQTLSDDDRDMALVADVHTGRDKALTVATGRADDLIAIVPIEGKLYFARGTAMSFYEFHQPISNRLTDEAWKKMLAKGKAPARPHWTNVFFTPVRAKEIGD